MKCPIRVILKSLLIVSLFAGAASLRAQGTAFTYQGLLNAGGSPANGSYDLTFQLFNAATNGAGVGPILTNDAIAVSNGLFTVTLDFGAGIFTGTSYWVEIGARTNGSGAFTKLSPLLPITPTPYAIAAGSASSVLTVAASNITGVVALAQLPGVVLTNNESGVALGGTFSGGFSGGGTNLSLLGGSGYNNSYYANANVPVVGWCSFYAGINGTNISSGMTNIYCNIGEFDALVYATNLLNDGMAAYAGGSFMIAIDGGWEGGRSNGVLYANTTNFPHGMPWLIAKLHSMGFKVRLYIEVGNPANGDRDGCTSTPDTGGTNVATDAETFEAWGVDAVDVDAVPDNWRDCTDEQKHQYHEAFMNALKLTGRPIAYYMHTTLQNYTNGMQPWMTEANTMQPVNEYGWLPDEWQDTIYRWYSFASNSGNLRPGHTLSTLSIGVYSLNDLNNSEGYFMLSCAAMFQGPIIFSADPMQWGGAAWRQFATNSYIRRIQTDSLYIPPSLAATNGANTELWRKPLNDGTTALFLINRSTFNETISFDASILGVAPNAAALFTDCWHFTNYAGSGSQTFALGSDSCQLWLMNPNTNGATFSGNFTGNGAGLTNVTATALSGTVSSGSLSGTYASAVTFNNAGDVFAGNGAGLTNVTATILSGNYTNQVTLTNAGNVFAGNGAGLTNLNGANLAGASVTPDKLSPVFGCFYLLGPPDAAATIAAGSAVPFPENGPVNGISRVNNTDFTLPAIGVYEVIWQVSISEAGQLDLALNGVEQPQTVVGRSAGTSQIMGNALLQTTTPNTVLEVRNPAGNPAPLTVTPYAGGAQAATGTLVIKRIQ